MTTVEALLDDIACIPIVVTGISVPFSPTVTEAGILVDVVDVDEGVTVVSV